MLFAILIVRLFQKFNDNMYRYSVSESELNNHLNPEFKRN